MEAHAQKSLKSGVIFAAVGVMMALAAPPLLASVAASIGLAAGGLLGAATVASVLGSGLVFGGFGMLYPRIRSQIDPAPGKLQLEAESPNTTARRGGLDRQAVEPLEPPEQFLPGHRGEEAKATFRQKLEADRRQRIAAESLGL